MIEINTRPVILWLVDVQDENEKASGEFFTDEQRAAAKARVATLLGQGELLINKVRQDLGIDGTMCVCTEPLPELGHSLKGDEYCSCCGKARS